MRTMVFEKTRIVRSRWGLVVLLVLILVAASLRLWHLDVLPPGLSGDEAFNGLDARRVLEGGYLPIYFPGNYGREPLFIYLQTLSVWLLGPTPFALRFVSALLGILTVPTIYFAARTILGTYPLGQRLGTNNATLPTIAALAAAAGMAVSYWHLSISRLGFRTMMLPLVSALAIAFFWRGWMNGRSRDYGWSGVWFAVSLYTYVAARLLPLVVALFVLSEMVFDLWRLRQNRGLLWERWRPRLKGLGLMALVGVLLVAPLLRVFWTNPALLSARTANVSVFTAPPSYMPGTPVQRIVHNIVVTAGSFYTGGDQNVRHNLPNRPVNDLLLAILFTVGWLAALVRFGYPHARLILFWLVVMLAPVVLSIEAPHALRGTGALPAIALLYGLGTYTLALAVAWIGQRLDRQRPSPVGKTISKSRDVNRLASIAGFLLLAGIVLGSGARTASDYFGKWARLPDLGEAFSLNGQLAAAETARLLADPSHPGVLLPSGLFLTPQMGYAVGNKWGDNLPQSLASPQETRPPIYRLVEEQPSGAISSHYLVWSEAGQPKSVRVKIVQDTQSQPSVLLESQQPFTMSLRSPIQQPGWAQVIMDALPANVSLKGRAISYPLKVDFDNGLTLAGYDVTPDTVTPGEKETPIYLTLFWKRTQSADDGLVGHTRSKGDQVLNVGGFDVFVHLANENGVWKTNNGPIPGGAYLNSSRTVILDEVREFSALPAMSPGKAFFEVGLYKYDPTNATSGQDRLAIVNDQGQPVADSVTLGGIWIGAEPAQADFSDLSPLGVQFANQIELVGWRVQSDPATPSQIQVILGWRGIDRPTSDYTAFVHLIDESGSILAQADQPPAGIDNPSHLWAPGETARTVFSLALPADSADKQTRLRIGLYEPVSGRQLPITAGQYNSAGVVGEPYIVIPAPLQNLGAGGSDGSAQ